MAVFGLLVTTPLCAEPPRDDQIQADQPPNGRPEHQPKHVGHGLDPAIQLRHQLRDATNKGLVGIVSEGTDETVDMAVALAAEHDGVRLLPVAGPDASQNVKDVIFARGIDFGIVPTDVLGEIRRNPPFPRVEKYLQYVTSYMTSRFICWPGRISSRSVIWQARRSILGGATAEPISLRPTSSTRSGSSRKSHFCPIRAPWIN
jgi:hypothetical protein